MIEVPKILQLDNTSVYDKLALSISEMNPEKQDIETATQLIGCIAEAATIYYNNNLVSPTPIEDILPPTQRQGLLTIKTTNENLHNLAARAATNQSQKLSEAYERTKDPYTKDLIKSALDDNEIFAETNQNMQRHVVSPYSQLLRVVAKESFRDSTTDLYTSSGVADIAAIYIHNSLQRNNAPSVLKNSGVVLGDMVLFHHANLTFGPKGFDERIKEYTDALVAAAKVTSSRQYDYLYPEFTPQEMEENKAMKLYFPQESKRREKLFSLRNKVLLCPFRFHSGGGDEFG